MFKTAKNFILILAVNFLCLSCANTSKSLISYVRLGLINEDPTLTHNYNPDFEYIRVQVDESVSLLALGYTIQKNEAEEEIWYSSAKQVLKITDGRITGLTGSNIEIVNVTFQSLPKWKSIKNITNFKRVTDLNPNYQFSRVEDLSVKRIKPPKKINLFSYKKENLIWYLERSKQQILSSEDSIYAIHKFKDGRFKVVYGKQCFSDKFCISWQRLKLKNKKIDSL